MRLWGKPRWGKGRKEKYWRSRRNGGKGMPEKAEGDGAGVWRGLRGRKGEVGGGGGRCGIRAGGRRVGVAAAHRGGVGEGSAVHENFVVMVGSVLLQKEGGGGKKAQIAGMRRTLLCGNTMKYRRRLHSREGKGFTL